MRKQVHTVTAKEAPRLLTDFLAAHLNCSLRRAKRLLDERSVFVNHKRVWMARHALKPGDVVEICEASSSAKPTPDTIPILFENADYLVVNKPSGLLSNGADSVEAALRNARDDTGLTAAHRLDKDTTGCLLLARNPEAFKRAVSWFREGQVLKVYQALVRDRLRKRKGSVKIPLDHEPAVTHWTVLSTTDIASHLQLKIDTGRTHQIRKHLSRMGHPILGDRHYFTGRLDDSRFRSVPRQMLHASSFQAPLGNGNKTVHVHAPLPRDFRNTLKQFGLR